MLNVNKEIREEGLKSYTYTGESCKSKIQTAVFLDNGGTEGIYKVFEIRNLFIFRALRLRLFKNK